MKINASPRVIIWAFMMVTILLGMVGAVIYGLQSKLVRVIIDSEMVVGKYHHELDKFVSIIGENRDLATSAAVTEFEYRGDKYRIEIPTKARVTEVCISSASLYTHETELCYKTYGFGEDKRLSRVFKNLDPR
jgi:CheY-specific phosphatase CheX